MGAPQKVAVMPTRPKRPERAELEVLIRETGGNMTALADRLGVARQTAYTWIYQLGLERVVGVRLAEQGEGKSTVPRLRSVSLRVDAALWKAVRLRAVEEDLSATDVVTAALRAYLEAQE